MVRTQFIPCRIGHGGFSSERVFELSLADGEMLVGTANVQYLRDTNRHRLDEDSPGYGRQIDGFVECRIVREVDGSKLVEVPSADVVQVSSEDLVTM